MFNVDEEDTKIGLIDNDFTEASEEITKWIKLKLDLLHKNMK
jgi:hypothetical protein